MHHHRPSLPQLFHAAVHRPLPCLRQRCQYPPRNVREVDLIQEQEVASDAPQTRGDKLAALVRKLEQQHVNLKFQVTPPIGEDEDLVAAIAAWVVRRAR